MSMDEIILEKMSGHIHGVSTAVYVMFGISYIKAQLQAIGSCCRCFMKVIHILCSGAAMQLSVYAPQCSLWLAPCHVFCSEDMTLFS